MVVAGLKTAFSHYCASFITHGTTIALVGSCSLSCSESLAALGFSYKTFSLEALLSGSEERK